MKADTERNGECPYRGVTASSSQSESGNTSTAERLPELTDIVLTPPVRFLSQTSVVSLNIGHYDSYSAQEPPSSPTKALTQSASPSRNSPGLFSPRISTFRESLQTGLSAGRRSLQELMAQKRSSKNFYHIDNVIMSVISACDHLTDVMVLIIWLSLDDPKIPAEIIIMGIFCVVLTTIIPALYIKEWYVRFTMPLGFGMVGLVHRFNQELEHIDQFTHYRELWNTLQDARALLKEHKRDAAQKIILECDAFHMVTNLPKYAKENIERGDSLKRSISKCLGAVNKKFMILYGPKFYKIIESVTESLPHMMLQIYIAIIYSPGGDWSFQKILFYFSIVVSLFSNSYAGASMMFPDGFDQVTLAVFQCLCDIVFRCGGMLYICICVPLGATRLLVLSAYVLGGFLTTSITLGPGNCEDILTITLTSLASCMSGNSAYFIISNNMRDLRVRETNLQYMIRFFSREITFRVCVTLVSLVVGTYHTFDYMFVMIPIVITGIIDIACVCVMVSKFETLNRPPESNFMDVFRHCISKFAYGYMYIKITVIFPGILYGMLYIWISHFQNSSNVKLALYIASLPILILFVLGALYLGNYNDSDTLDELRPPTFEGLRSGETPAPRVSRTPTPADILSSPPYRRKLSPLVGKE